MAKPANAAPAAKKSFTKADGFINLRIADKSGKQHGFKVGIPLYRSRPVDAALLSDPRKLQAAIEDGRITISIWTPSADEQEDLDF